MIRRDDVVLRLSALGYNADNGDSITLELSINSAEEYIKNYCNIGEIPNELYNTALDICCGIFLKTKSSIGGLGDYNIGAALTSITEGDVSISYGNCVSSEELFNTLVDKLISKEDILVCYRRLKW